MSLWAPTTTEAGRDCASPAGAVGQIRGGYALHVPKGGESSKSLPELRVNDRSRSGGVIRERAGIGRSRKGRRSRRVRMCAVR